MTSYNRHDPAKGYIAHVFHADRVAQSAEPNEMQSEARYQLRRVADALFADGEITTGARCTVDAETGACQLEAGSIYLAGGVRDVPAAQLQISVQGTVTVGVHYSTRVVTAEEDPSLYNPAQGTSGYGEPGADRLKLTVAWGLQGQGAGDFYPVWTIEDGIVKPRDAGLQANAVAEAIKRYDVDSAGGTYAVRGLKALQLDDDSEGRQVYAIGAGAARVGGAAVEVPADRRLVFTAQADMAAISSEPHSSSTDALQHVSFDRWPVLEPAQVRIQRRRTDPVVHGSFVGAADPLPVNSVVQINSITQGGTTYQKDIDYKLTAGQIDWSPAGAEPTPGSTYTATYEYISTEGVQNQTTRGFDVAGALPGTLILVDYRHALRRIDRIVINADGGLDVVKGMPATWQPVAPDVPEGLLALASIYQTWEPDTRRTDGDGVRTVSMPTLVGYRRRMDEMEMDLAELRLALDINGRYSGLKKGYFADPMIDNSMRDQGMPQTAMIAQRALRLYEAEDAHTLGDGKTSQGLDYTLAKAISQPGYSRAMVINGTPTPGALPATITLTPDRDRWEHPKELAYPVWVTGAYIGIPMEQTGTLAEQYAQQVDPALIDTSGITMRSIEVQFGIAGFNPDEPLKLLQFDGQTVVPSPLAGGTLVANAAGVLAGRFTIPAGIPVGAKAVKATGDYGSSGTAQFVGSAALRLRVDGMYSTYYNARGSSSETITYVV